MNIRMEDLTALGWRPSPAIGHAMKLWKLLERRGVSRDEFLAAMHLPGPITTLPANTKREARLVDELNKSMSAFAAYHAEEAEARERRLVINDEPCPYRVWGAEQIGANAIAQMVDVCRIAPAVRGALMPDAHHGYTMPIGGVLATEGAVIPPAVGVDIACRMRLTIVGVPMDRWEKLRDVCRKALLSETAFGVNSRFGIKERRDHEVLEDPRWDDLPHDLRQLRDKAWNQLGSSGTGNHFVEWGEVRVVDRDGVAAAASPEFASAALAPEHSETRWLALLSHSGSRGFGANIAGRYTRLAADRSGLDQKQRHLAWLSLDDDAGREYWLGMELAGAYAAANHCVIHETVIRAAGLHREPSFAVENHHNFAWKEIHDGREVVVHRKGATPAGAGVLGIIPGSMGDPGYLVRGRGSADALDSASHGAGRRMSRTAAKNSVTRNMVNEYLAERGIELLGGGLDEAPMAYKNIGEVLSHQSDLVNILAEFKPRMVRMADDEEKPRRRRRAD